MSSASDVAMVVDGETHHDYMWNSKNADYRYNKSGTDLASGDVVVQDLTNNRAVTRTTTEADARLVLVLPQVDGADGLAQDVTSMNNALGWFQFAGYIGKVNVTGAVARGDFLVTSSTAGRARSAGAQWAPGAFARAESSAAGPGNGTVAALLLPLSPQRVDGWTSAGETWTYATATTFTVAGDVTAKYARGDKARLKQGGAFKYFYILSTAYGAPNTTVTVTGGSDYTLANATITDHYYSHSAAPVGFPTWFNWSPAFTGFSVSPTGVFRFCLSATACTIVVRMIAGTSNATSFKLTAPLTAATIANVAWFTAAQVVDNGAYLATPGYASLSSAGTTITVGKDWNAGEVWTAANGKFAQFILTFEI